ncbi:hypothetical protein OG730_04910 [Streptomyces sp. NBC_01298]|uniref:hypothetical protein n=1 Tax=Streptomyces sp. NBC_01298 TaxID=2903817 RepID=UPI002E121D95|nr:hypothetical protein OG730_04910 [Streptomyces sp. NBC_01298]
MTSGTCSRRLPRLRYALRHPADVLDRSGVSLWLAALVLTFTASVLGGLVLLYFTRLS